MQYAAQRRLLIRYPEFRARGWQIGSGPTEAECQTTTRRLQGRFAPLGFRQRGRHDDHGVPAR